MIQEGLTPLCVAADVDVVEALIQHGANVNQQAEVSQLSLAQG